MPDFSKFIPSIMPYIEMYLRGEFTKREIMDRLKAQLQEYAAWGEEQRKTGKQSLQNEIIKNLYNPEYFKDKNMPELAIMNYIQKTNPQLLGETQVPADIGQQLQDATNALAQITKFRMAGEAVPDELLQKVSQFFGEKALGETATDIIKQKEGAAERGLRGREITVEEKKLPIERGKLAAKWKELEGQIGDMTAKEARAELSDLGVERRRYQAQLQTKANQLGELLSEEEINYIKSNIAEIKKLEDKINSKHGETIGAEYKAVADGLRAKGYTAADLDTNEQIRSALIERGYNINALKKYMK
jgi:hypothetical protein